MVSDRVRGVHNLCLLTNLILVGAVYWAWLQVYDGRVPLTDAQVRDYLFFLEMLLLGLALGIRSQNSGRDIIHPGWALANSHALRQVAGALFAVFIGVAAFHLVSVSRLFIFSFVPLLYATLLLGNRHLPTVIARRLFRGARAEKIALIGPPAKAGDLQGWLKNKEPFGFQTIGIISDDPVAAGPDGQWLGPMADLENVLRDRRITQVILVEIPRRSEVLRQCVQVCEKLAVRLLAVSDLEDQFRHSIRLFEDGGMRFVSLRDEPLEDPFNRMVKRAMDVTISLPVTLLVLPPAVVVVWLLQRIQAPGPVFFVQNRIGMQGRTFKIIKFRTMRLTGGNEARQATEGDDRIYPAGRWLRKLSIDELPQFFNALTGEMSVIGPRPHLKEHNEIFARALDNFHVRSYVKPGITGLAQIRGHRGEIKEERDIIERVKSDIYYIEHWSFAMDCYIVARTFLQVIFPPRTAY
jgi:exopolysaccharide biosynthesis polyprenyl glycosylphosphotransferase